MTTRLLDPAQAFADWLLALDPLLVCALTALLTALETTALVGLVVPGDAVALLAGSTTTGELAFVGVVAAATIGSLAGETGGYLIGRLVGPRLRGSRLGRRIGKERWSQAEAQLDGKGAKVLVAVRFVAVLHAVAPLVAGAVRMPYPRFAGWSALGAALWATLFTTVGMLAGSAYRQYHRLGLAVTLVVLAVFGLATMAAPRGRPAPPAGTGNTLAGKGDPRAPAGRPGR